MRTWFTKFYHRLWAHTCWTFCVASLTFYTFDKHLKFVSLGNAAVVIAAWLTLFLTTYENVSTGRIVYLIWFVQVASNFPRYWIAIVQSLEKFMVSKFCVFWRCVDMCVRLLSLHQDCWRHTPLVARSWNENKLSKLLSLCDPNRVFLTSFSTLLHLDCST